MRARAAVLCLCVAAGPSIGCSYKNLSRFFDGVPPPAAAPAPGAPASPGPPPGGPAPRMGYTEHGPYAAKLCGTCHLAGATNALVAPPEELCLGCHEIRPRARFVHGPLASGGCVVCHDPHSSPNRYLLVSDPDGFCLHCHDPRAVDRIPGHAAADGRCTDCHDAHMSDQKYLLK